jgi:hypothetical protein
VCGTCPACLILPPLTVTVTVLNEGLKVRKFCNIFIILDDRYTHLIIKKHKLGHTRSGGTITGPFCTEDVSRLTDKSWAFGSIFQAVYLHHLKSTCYSSRPSCDAVPYSICGALCPSLHLSCDKWQPSQHFFWNIKCMTNTSCCV